MSLKEDFFTIISSLALYTLGAFIVGISLIPSYFIVRYALSLNFILIKLFLIGFSYFVFGMFLMIVVVIFIRILNLRVGEGEYPIGSFQTVKWLLYAGLLQMVDFFFLTFARGGLNNLFYKALGAKIGENTIIIAKDVNDLHLIEIGDNVLIGDMASIIGHVAEKGKLILKRVKIGNNVTIGQYTTVFPGTIIEDDVIVGANSLVPKSSVLERGWIYGGVPVRKIKRWKE